MNENEFDVIVVGAGPAGSSATYFCAEKGLKVLLLDKEVFPRDKTCGDGLSGKSVKFLKEMHLEDEIQKVQHSLIKAVRISSPNGTELTLEIPQTKEKKTYGYCCKRFLFDNIIFKAASKKAAKTIEGFTVTDVLIEKNFVVGVKGKAKDGSETEFRAKAVIGADGANSVIASKLGLVEKNDRHLIHALRQYYTNVSGTVNAIELHFLEELLPGYFWIFPVGNNEVNVGLGIVEFDRKKKNLDLRKALEKIIKENPNFKERFKNARKVTEVKGWQLLLGSKRRKCYGNGFLLLGDAASLIDPFTGEGIGNGMLSGKLAAEAIKEAFEKNDFSEAMLSKYNEMLSKELDEELKNNYALQKMLNIKFIVNKLFTKAQKDEKLKETLAWTLTKDKPLKSFGKIDMLLKALF